MKPDRLHQVDEIFQAALDLPPEERSAYLSRACAGDPELGKEIQSLISAFERAGAFIETPAIEIDASVVAGSLVNSLAGHSIGHYQIIQPLGAGGMGEVYLAADTRTERKVALKLLPDDLTKNDERVRRFQQEARAALALNHPNIVTIYEIGEADGRLFISSEWIQGETLGQRLQRAPLSLSEALDIAVQVGSALNEAHQQGIVHRDIKPENIMLRPDGYVKVLDFGIAKLTELQTVSVASEAPTALKVRTAPGMVIGTANYMSPEQARGLAVDQRTDIWSLGVVLYEMVAGCVPFAGETPGDVVASILERQPAPLARYSRQAPEALEEIVTTALAKNREERYQTATQMIAALRRLKQRLDATAELERSMPPHGSSLTGAMTSTNSLASTAQAGLPHAASSAEYIVSEIKRHQWSAAIIVSLLILVVAGLAFGLYKVISQWRTTSPFPAMKITRLTTSGKAVDATISPDGKLVAYLNLDEGGRESIWLRQVATSSNVKLVDAKQLGLFGLPRGLTFSPDGNYLYYRARTVAPTGNTNVYALFRIPVLGGDAHKLIDSVYSPISFSPDGKRMAFVRNNQPVVGKSYLIVANPDDTDERVISTHKLSEAFALPGWPMTPAWSPDGKTLVCAAGNYPSLLIEVQVDGGVERPIGPPRWAHIDHLSWLPDGSALLLAVQEESASRLQIWEVSYPSGEARRITNDLNSYRGTSLTADANTMAVVQTVTQSDIWIMPNARNGEARRITAGTGNDDGYHGLSWTPNGKLIYASDATGNLELWSIDATGANQKQITSDAHQYDAPIVTPDGRYIVFYSNRTGPLNLWRTDADGSNPKQLTNGMAIFGGDATCSPDGKMVVYASQGSRATPVLWRMGIDGGEPVQLTEDKYWAELPSISPDGTRIAFQYFGLSEVQPVTIGAIPIEGGPISQLAHLPQRIFRSLRWTPDGNSIAYINDFGGTQNLWAVPAVGGQPKQLTNFNGDQLIFSFDWSKDGKQLALARGTQVSDVVLISNFK